MLKIKKEILEKVWNFNERRFELFCNMNDSIRSACRVADEKNRKYFMRSHKEKDIAGLCFFKALLYISGIFVCFHADIQDCLRKYDFLNEKYEKGKPSLFEVMTDQEIEKYFGIKIVRH